MPLMLTSSTQENMQEKDVFLSILKTDILERKKNYNTNIENRMTTTKRKTKKKQKQKVK